MLSFNIRDAPNVKDGEKLYRYNGILYPAIVSPAENLKALESFQARPDDVMLVAYPKCGFNWMVAVLRKIMAAGAMVTKEASQMPPLIEFCSPEVQKIMDAAPCPRILGTHLHPNNIPASFTAKRSKMLVVFRNPKDTAVSYYHFTCENPVLPQAKSWGDFYSKFMTGEVAWGSYFDHALAWEKCMDDPNVMIVTFEDMKKNLQQQIKEVSKFLNVSLAEDEITVIAKESTFSVMKEHSKESHGQMGDVFFRKGEVGDWKNHFSKAQSQEMDTVFEKHLSGTRLADKLQYHLYC
ncbi:sulfotransferase 6B1-like [Brienomyrus brachyistius]|uniref:sulfotransferase 6B1-like n=1 Tax=Brienomyrus brachyistius TaxID=42636 RepID=UPI0020B2C244|nr:sulfotransferase 6B1-like [Brienomyrus brachyistius]